MVRWFAAPAMCLLAGICVLGHPEGAGEAIDTQRSTVTIHVGKAGLFAAAAHEHWVNAPISAGVVETAGPTPSVKFGFEASKLQVKPAQGVSESDQATVQSNMQSKVLESSKYPRILFQSTRVQPSRDTAWKVSGDLTLHGVTKPVVLDVSRKNGAYVGSIQIKQTEFGIQPIKIGGGLVKVRDELDITFEIYTVAGSRARL